MIFIIKIISKHLTFFIIILLLQDAMKIFEFEKENRDHSKTKGTSSQLEIVIMHQPGSIGSAFPSISTRFNLHFGYCNCFYTIYQIKQELILVDMFYLYICLATCVSDNSSQC